MALLTTGDKLGPYEIIAPIGKGGMGEVWKARDTRLERMVAIKVSAAEFSERFEREARAVAALNHNHICQLYDVGPNYLVMEYIEGKPLAGPLPVDQALQYAIQIAEALEAAHQKGIVHRDLKPANIMVEKGGGEAAGFRAGEDERDVRRRGRRHAHHSADQGKHHPGHVAVHGAGATGGQGRRSASRYLRFWNSAI